MFQVISVADINKTGRLAALAPSSTCPLETLEIIYRFLGKLTYRS